MRKRWLIGLSLGSSLGAIDAALVEGTGVGLDLRPRLEHFLSLPLPRDLRELLHRTSAPGPVNVKQLGLLHRLLGESFALAARQLADGAKVPLGQVLCLGCPGLTLCHDTDGRFPTTLALGMASVIAERTGITTVGDFRSRDVLLGGQGYPLTAIVDYLLFQRPGEPRVLIHLGGVSTILYLPGELNLRGVLGFQAGPCNLLLDNLMHQLTGGREAFDPGGKHAVQGCCIEALLQRWLAHPALQRRPPRSLPRHEFGDDFVSQALHLAKHNNWSLHDLLCTATHFAARCTVQALERFVPRGIGLALLSGGGVRNGLLWRLLEQNLQGVRLERTNSHGIPVDARKAAAFAGLAGLALDGLPANLPGVTGASASRLLGEFTPGSSANWARCLAWMNAQSNSVSLAA